MAEHEVAKHTVKAIKLFSDKKKTWWERAKEILLEIAIIVFAITFSLWMHNRSEHNHNQKNVQQFLSGIKEDLQKDIGEMEQDTDAIVKRIGTIHYIQAVNTGKQIYNQDTINKLIYPFVFSSTLLIPNSGRYEGFKSSGQLGFIENNELADLIVDHYQEKISSLLWVSQLQNDFLKSQFVPYISTHIKLDDKLGIGNIQSALKESELNIILFYYLSNSLVIRDRYRVVIQSSKTIINAINKETR